MSLVDDGQSILGFVDMAMFFHVPQFFLFHVTRAIYVWSSRLPHYVEQLLVRMTDVVACPHRDCCL